MKGVIVFGLIGFLLIALIVLFGSGLADECSKKCAHGGVLVKNYWGMPECLCQGAP